MIADEIFVYTARGPAFWFACVSICYTMSEEIHLRLEGRLISYATAKENRGGEQGPLDIPPPRPCRARPPKGNMISRVKAVAARDRHQDPPPCTTAERLISQRMLPETLPTKGNMISCVKAGGKMADKTLPRAEQPRDGLTGRV